MYVGWRRRADLLMSRKVIADVWFFLGASFSLFLSTFNNNSPTRLVFLLLPKFPDKEPRRTTCVVEGGGGGGGVCASSSSLLGFSSSSLAFSSSLFPFALCFPSLYFLSRPFLFGWLFGRESRVPDTERAKRIELQCDICFVLFGLLISVF